MGEETYYRSFAKGGSSILGLFPLLGFRLVIYFVVAAGYGEGGHHVYCLKQSDHDDYLL
jgi:hypothetical protein